MRKAWNHVPLHKAAAAMNLSQDLGYSSNQIGAQLDMPGSTIRQILQGHGRWGEVAEQPVFIKLRQEQKKHLEAASRALSSKCLIQVEEQLPKASAYQAAGIYGLLRTHERLDAGEATENVAHLHVHEVKALDWIAERLQGRLAKMESNAVTDTDKKP